MNKLAFLFIIAACLFAGSCKDTWDEDDKKIFHKACVDDARTWAGSEERVNTYCDCVLDKILKKYPHENDALEHMDSIIKDPGVRTCRDIIAK